MGAPDIMAELGAAGFSVTADGNKLLVRPFSKLTGEQRAELRQHKAEVLALLAEPPRPYKLTPAEADEAHRTPWDGAAIARFVARVALFMRRGLSAADAVDLAERLHLRDVRADDRRLCLECAHLAGRPGAWRCGNARAAGVGTALPAGLVTALQRCGGFEGAAS